MEKLDPEGVIVRVGKDRFKYFQDRGRRWPFWTGERGAKLLVDLLRDTARLLAINDQKITDKEVLEHGERIYADKPTLKATRKQYDNELGNSTVVTWSSEEYAHPGLQRMYLKLKSVQRFTEMWSLLERVHSRGLFDEDLRSRRSLRFVSIGGGPGFELLACKRFFESLDDGIEVSCLSLDLESSWKEYAEALGCEFGTWDLSKGNFEQVSGGKPDYVLLSAVAEMYMANDGSADMLERILRRGVRAALVSSRAERLLTAILLRKRGIRCVSVMENPQDERQCVFLGTETELEKVRADFSVSVTFSNVPYVRESRR